MHCYCPQSSGVRMQGRIDPMGPTLLESYVALSVCAQLVFSVLKPQCLWEGAYTCVCSSPW